MQKSDFPDREMILLIMEKWLFLGTMGYLA